MVARVDPKYLRIPAIGMTLVEPAPRELQRTLPIEAALRPRS